MSPCRCGAAARLSAWDSCGYTLFMFRYFIYELKFIRPPNFGSHELNTWPQTHSHTSYMQKLYCLPRTPTYFFLSLLIFVLVVSFLMWGNFVCGSFLIWFEFGLNVWLISCKKRKEKTVENPEQIIGIKSMKFNAGFGILFIKFSSYVITSWLACLLLATKVFFNFSFHSEKVGGRRRGIVWRFLVTYFIDFLQSNEEWNGSKKNQTLVVVFIQHEITS